MTRHPLQAACVSPALRRQCGASLIVSLLMLMAILMLGTSAAEVALQGEKAARNDGDRQVALQAAEDALADAELDIERSSRSRLFGDGGMEEFDAACDGGRDAGHLGLCLPAATGQLPVWRRIDTPGPDGRRPSVPYGHFTGRRFQAGAGPLPARLPSYLIEPMRAVTGPAAEGAVRFYRITAIGFGMRETTQVVLQMYYRKAGGATAMPAGRFGWREIANWQEWRDAPDKD